VSFAAAVVTGEKCFVGTGGECEGEVATYDNAGQGRPALNNITLQDGWD